MSGFFFRDAEERERFAEFFAKKQDELNAAQKHRRSNRDFTQVYGKGWARIRSILNETRAKTPLLLYTFLAEHIDSDGGSLVVDQETLCEALNVSRTTLWRAITFLEERGALWRLTVGGSVSAYALDPSEIWKSFDTAKDQAVFRTKTMVRKSAQTDEVRRRMKVYVKEKAGTPELPFETPHDPETGEIH